ncbi:MAG: family 43 glycosylhydrolase [Gemmatimonadota bacterium]
MRRLRRLPLLATLAILLAGPADGQHIEIGVHDPVMAEADGTFYLYHTGRGISVRASPDMESWERLPPVFEDAPAWATDINPRFRNHIWAPDISYHDGTYYLYYSVSSFGSNSSAIGVATNTTLDPDDPDYAWVDHGPVVRSVPGRDLWNAIDPNLVVDDDGRPWLTFGSFWNGIKLVRLAEDRLRVARPEEWRTIAARHRYWKLSETDAGDTLNSAIEAPFIFRKDGWYYLFVSWDRCCAGPQSTYKIAVGRSRSVTGPYLDRAGQDMRFGGGTLVARGDSAWAGVGHNAAYTIDGTDYLVFHGYDLSDRGRSKLWITEIDWDADGWPHVSLKGGDR